MRHLATAALLFTFGCKDGTTPVQPTPSVATAPPDTSLVYSLSGSVQDTASRPITGSRVEVIAGDRLGAVETTDRNGRSRLPGTFTGAVTVLAS